MDKDAGGEQQSNNCHCVEDARKSRRNKAQPWIMLKFTVGLTIAMDGYASYVYVVRLCVPMLQRKSGALGGLGLGIAFVFIFSLLLFMNLWTYTKAIITSPGHAKDHIPKSEPPLFPLRPPHDFGEPDVGISYEDVLDHPPRPTLAPLDANIRSSQPHSSPQSEAQRDAGLIPNFAEKPPPSRSQREGRSSYRRTASGVTPGDSSASESTSPVATAETAAQDRDLEAPSTTPTMESEPRLPSQLTRRPPTTPVLLPEYRYCSRDGLVKPFRTHHCRACGTCILKYDHHCPWIGQCVGARNQKFFVNFLQWGSLFCFWVFASTLGVNTSSKLNPNGNVDVQQIIIIILGGLFGLFTTAMLLTHIQLIILNRTTVESLQLRAMKAREEVVLTRLHPCYAFRAKKRTKKRWDEEWGNLTSEGNIWWLGSRKLNWQAVMGTNPWWWFLPIGHSASDGLNYLPNPRFDEHGRWRRRKEWPVELR